MNLHVPVLLDLSAPASMFAQVTLAFKREARRNAALGIS